MQKEEGSLWNDFIHFLSEASVWIAYIVFCIIWNFKDKKVEQKKEETKQKEPGLRGWYERNRHYLNSIMWAVLVYLWNLTTVGINNMRSDFHHWNDTYERGIKHEHDDSLTNAKQDSFNKTVVIGIKYQDSVNVIILKTLKLKRKKR